MKPQLKFATAMLCGVSALAIGTAAYAQGSSPETVTVTGSRIIGNAANSPTPLTSVALDQIQITTPTNVADALNELPVFEGASNPRRNNNSSANSAGNVLNLRNFGSARTLVLFDSHRLANANLAGTVDVDVIPEMLVSRIDVVTGGASAVYGSDAITGVVNYVLDKHFNGVKIEASAGISTYGDYGQYKGGVAMGTDLFGSRGHIEFSLEHTHTDPILILDRPYGPGVFLQTGSGTVANPFQITKNTRTASKGIVCTCGTYNGAPLNGQLFISNGVVGLFTHGAPSPSSGIEIGGDGSVVTKREFYAALTTSHFFTNFNYNITDDISVYVSLNAADANNFSSFSNANAGGTFFKTNPYLPPAVAAAMTGNTFTYTQSFDQVGSKVISDQRDLSGRIGFTGSLFGDFAWDVFYTHDEERNNVVDPNGTDTQKKLAASDAVLAPLTGPLPAGVTAGQVVCSVTLTNPGLYPGCVPLNAFGPTAATAATVAYYSITNSHREDDILDNLGGSISGEVYRGWGAGPIKAAFSGEYRNVFFDVTSPYDPLTKADCTGLRLCDPDRPPGALGGNGVTFFQAAQNVWEVALESEIPILKDLPLVQSFDVNLAGRYTDYSTSGPVQTWKIGGVYHVNEDFSFRATDSVDIRAPALNQLYGLTTSGGTGFVDIHTASSGGVTTVTQSNANLVPEVAHTYTGGLVFTPTFIPGLTASIDYYDIKIKNALTSVGGNSSAIVALCESSGGTSPFCALYIRPLPFSDHTTANFPTKILTEQLNTAFTETAGEDIEVNYHFDLGDVVDGMPGVVALRSLASLVPNIDLLSTPGAEVQHTIQPKFRDTSYINYTNGNFALNIANRYWDHFNNSPAPSIVYKVPVTPHVDYVDVGATYNFDLSGSRVQGTFSVKNIFNTQPPLYATPTNANPGLSYPTLNAETDPGRQFTITLRASY